ncbi:MAG: hypothetical protein N2C14_16310, partial [Planctomycetales bacterium]
MIRKGFGRNLLWDRRPKYGKAPQKADHDGSLAGSVEGLDQTCFTDGDDLGVVAGVLRPRRNVSLRAVA